MVTQENMADILGVISGLMLDDRALPKYRYPSAGSSYSVRCFVNIPRKIGDINSGYYYYHPIRYGLSRIGKKQGDKLEIHLKPHLQAIEPLYKKQAQQFALQESGHMLSLLLDEMDFEELGYEVSLHKDSVVKIIIGGEKRFIPSIKSVP